MFLCKKCCKHTFLSEKGVQRTSHRPTFLIRKVGKRISHRTYHFILAKLLKIRKKLFSKSFLCQGLGRIATTYNAIQKNAEESAFFFYQNMLELRSKLCFKRLFEKSPLKIRKNFAPNISLYFGEAFEVLRNFSRKVSCVRVWADSHNI